MTRLAKVNVASKPPAGSAAAAGDVGAPQGAAPPSAGSGPQPPPLPAAAGGTARAGVRGVRSRYVDPLNAGSAGAAAPRAGFAPPPGALIDCLHLQVVRYYNKDAIALLVKKSSPFFKLRVLSAFVVVVFHKNIKRNPPLS